MPHAEGMLAIYQLINKQIWCSQRFTLPRSSFLHSLSCCFFTHSIFLSIFIWPLFVSLRIPKECRQPTFLSDMTVNAKAVIVRQQTWEWAREGGKREEIKQGDGRCSVRQEGECVSEWERDGGKESEGGESERGRAAFIPALLSIQSLRQRSRE